MKKWMSGWPMTAVLACGVLAGLAGCKSSDAVRQAKPIGDGTQVRRSGSAAPAPVLDPATLGAVSGTIHFSGKAPERVKIDMSMDPVCAMTGGDNTAEQYVVTGRQAGECVCLCEERAGGGDDGGSSHDRLRWCWIRRAAGILRM